MKPGDEFPERLRSLIDSAHATIVLIGKNSMPRAKVRRTVEIATDWVVKELEYSKSAPLTMPEPDRFGLSSRLVVPLFADCERDFRKFSLPESVSFLEELHSEHIDYAGWPSAIGPLLDRIAVKLSIKKRPDAR